MNKKISFAIIIMSAFVLLIFLIWSSFIKLTQSPYLEQVHETQTAEAHSIAVELTRIGDELEKTPFPKTSVNSRDWPESWVNVPTCLPPCWENIVPGKTTMDIAIRIVYGIPEVKFTYFYLTPHPTTQSKSIYWLFGESGGSGMIDSASDGIVLEIYLHLDRNQNLLLRDVIKKYGNPSSVIDGGCIGEVRLCEYILWYRELGIFLLIRAHSGFEEPVLIRENTLVERIVMFSPQHPLTLNDYKNQDGIFIELEWDGYKAYDFTNKR